MNKAAQLFHQVIHNTHKKEKAYPKRADLAGSGVSMLLQKYEDLFV